MKRYIGLIGGDAGGYGIVFPDLPGCLSMGATIEEVIANGTTAIRLWIEAADRAGQPIPEPSGLDLLRNDREAAAMWDEGAVIVGLPPRRVVWNHVLAAGRSSGSG